MPSNDAGKWVARAGATGGGRKYRGSVPVNWYAAVVLIVVLGILSVVYSQYEYRHATTTSTSGVAPTVTTKWYAGLAIDICGTQLPPLPSNAVAGSKTQGFFTSGTGLLNIWPKKGTQAGTNAVFGKFVKAYKGLTITSTEIQVPTGSKKTTYKNGSKCAKGTKDAGKVAQVHIDTWANPEAKLTKFTAVTGNPATIRFTQNQLITVAFAPSGTKPVKPTGKVVLALVKESTASSTATTLPATTPSIGTTITTTLTTTAATAATATTAPTTAPATALTPTTAVKPTTKPTTKPKSTKS
jgi:hypothetical protein